jgi:hypothetical protein
VERQAPQGVLIRASTRHILRKISHLPDFQPHKKNKMASLSPWLYRSNNERLSKKTNSYQTDVTTENTVRQEYLVSVKCQIHRLLLVLDLEEQAWRTSSSVFSRRKKWLV